MLHLETVEPATLALLRDILGLPELSETRLVGGTALALQLGHRVSVFVVRDVDKFKKLPVTARAILSKKLTESDVVDYLMSRGLGHLYKGAKEVAEDPRSLNRVMEECGKPLSGRAIYGLACFCFLGLVLFPLLAFALGPFWLRLVRVDWSHDARCLAAIGLVLLEGGLYWLMMRADGFQMRRGGAS